jgi:CRP/FNR family transcriptional regulator, dissimilatory nitrate respiration regulator
MQTAPRVNIEALLSHVPLFNGLSQDELARISRTTREIHASKGDVLFRKGDPCDGFHLLVYGQVKLAMTSIQGNEKVVAIVSPGQSFGEALMFMDSPYIVFAQALVDSLLLHIPKATIYDELQHDPKLCHKMLAGMAMRLHELMGDVEAYSLHSGTQRIIGYLLREISENDQNSKSVTVTLPTSKGVIASRLNLTQEHFSRILHELITAGLIVVEGRVIRIKDVEALRQHEC